jgi:hypothetical protein
MHDDYNQVVQWLRSATTDPDGLSSIHPLWPTQLAHAKAEQVVGAAARACWSFGHDPTLVRATFFKPIRSSAVRVMPAWFRAVNDARAPDAIITFAKMTLLVYASTSHEYASRLPWPFMRNLAAHAVVDVRGHATLMTRGVDLYKFDDHNAPVIQAMLHARVTAVHGRALAHALWLPAPMMRYVKPPELRGSLAVSRCRYTIRKIRDVDVVDVTDWTHGGKCGEASLAYHKRFHAEFPV